MNVHKWPLILCQYTWIESETRALLANCVSSLGCMLGGHPMPIGMSGCWEKCSASCVRSTINVNPMTMMPGVGFVPGTSERE